MARSIQNGRGLADELAARHPAIYEELGRPRPGYFENVRRTRFAQFVASHEFENLGDETLSARFESYRKSEARLIVSILVSGAIIAMLTFTASTEQTLSAVLLDADDPRSDR